MPESHPTTPYSESRRQFLASASLRLGAFVMALSEFSSPLSFARDSAKTASRGDPIESAYSQVHLYAVAVRKAGTFAPSKIRQRARGLIFGSPRGLIGIDPENQHTSKITRIGRVQDNGQCAMVWTSHESLHPDLYTLSR